MNKLNRFVVVVCCLVFVCRLHAQSGNPTLDSLLHRTLDSMRQVLNVKSLSAAMQFSNESIWADASGISSVSPAEEVTPAHVYLIGSVTKTITSACILDLVDEGVLSLNDSLYEWLDTMEFINPNITIRQLMQHTSGIYDVLANPACQPTLLADISAIWTPQQLINQFLKAPLFAPGTSWSYSNTNYMLLSMIIEKATGNPFYTEIRNRFFIPLGLSSFSIPAFEALVDPVAHVWMDITGDNISEDAHNFYINYLSLNSTAGAAGGYFSTPTDCTRWMRRYLRGDVVSAASLAAAKTFVTAPGAQGGVYGLGLFRRTFIGNQGLGHGGDLAYAASSWYFPGKDLSITVFTNDSKNNSWTLLPVVTELLRTCINHQAMTPTQAPLELVADGVQVYPNPFDDALDLNTVLLKDAEEVSITLSDASGKKLVCQEVKNVQQGEQVFTLDALERLPQGMYFVELKIDGNIQGAWKVAR
ncbi:MAG: serine hydrolase [Saprospiraceae bacterium]|nr:serine hydrolase [Saprospiraceae bacterium]